MSNSRRRRPTAQSIASARQFNRFYTRFIGVLNRGFLESEYSLTEVRVLYELRHREQMTATELVQDLGIDAGYLSRILRGFERRRLLVKESLKHDRRQRMLALSAHGKRIFDAIEERQRASVADMLGHLRPGEEERVIRAMETIERLLDGSSPPTAGYVIREPRPGDIGWIVHRQARLYFEEYGWDEQFEALIAEVAAKFIRSFDPAVERCWIAERDGEIVGSVFCVRESKTVAHLRLLYVEAAARHLGIGTRLVEECLQFARRVGYSKIALWTNHPLAAARRIYKRAGFKMTKQRKHHSFGRDLVGQTWELDLTGRG